MSVAPDWKRLSLREVKAIGQQSVQQIAHEELGKPPKEDPEGWLAALKSDDSDEREEGAYQLWQNEELPERGYDISEVTRALCAALTDENPQTRENVAWALEKCKDASLVMPVLVYLLCDDEEKVRDAAYCSLEKFSPESLPIILQVLRSKRAYWRAKAAWSLGYEFSEQRKTVLPHLLKAVKDPAAEVRAKAAHALARLVGKKAVPILVRLLKDRKAAVREAALASFHGHIREKGRAAIPAIVRCFRDSNKNVRERTAWTLYYIGRPAVPALLKCLKHRSPLVRALAAESLEHFQPLGKIVTRALAAALKDEDEEVRRRAIFALEKHGGKTAIPALLPFLRNKEDPSFHWATMVLGRLKAKEAIPHLLIFAEDPAVQRSAVSALKDIGLDKEVAILLFARLVRDPDPAVRSDALGGLKQWKREAAPALPGLIWLLQQGNNSRWELENAAKVLAEIGPAAKEAVPHLLPLLEREENVSAAAAIALWKIDSENEQVLGRLTQLLTEGDLTGSRLWTLCSLMGPRGKAGVPSLVEFLHNADWNEKGCVAEALKDMGAAAVEAVPALVTLLGDRDCPLGTVVRTLAAIGSAAVPELCKALEKKDPLQREFACNALSQIGSEASQAVPLLAGLLQDEHPGVRAWAAIALGKIARKSEAIPLLVETLSHSDAYHRLRAAEALAAIGPAAAVALRRLQEVRDNEQDESARKAMREALTRLQAQ
jgi:HEAT repeat protein